MVYLWVVPASQRMPLCVMKGSLKLHGRSYSAIVRVNDYRPEYKTYIHFLWHPRACKL